MYVHHTAYPQLLEDVCEASEGDRQPYVLAWVLMSRLQRAEEQVLWEVRRCLGGWLVG